MANSFEVAKNTNWSMGYIKDSGVSQKCWGKGRGRTGECTIAFVNVIEALSLPAHGCSLKYVNYSNSNIPNFYPISKIKPFKAFSLVKQHY